MKKITAATLLVGLACAAPVSASYFFNPSWGTMLNIGSAPNPTPNQLRAIGDSPYPAVRRAEQSATLRNIAMDREKARAQQAVYVTLKRSYAKNAADERRITAELNRGWLVRSKITASNGTAPASKAAATRTAATKIAVVKPVAKKTAEPKAATGATKKLRFRLASVPKRD